jgi:hypothetical protein
MTRQMFYQSESEEHAEMRTMAAMQVLHDVRGITLHAVTLEDPEARASHYASLEEHLARLDEQQLHDVALHAIGVIGIFDAKAAHIPIADDIGWRPEA